MSLIRTITKQSREVLLNGNWISTNFKTELSNVDWKIATKKVGSLNTIAALTFHINYYVAGLNNVFDGGSLDIRDKYSFDLPPITSQKDWQDLQNKFYSDAEKYVAHLEKMDDEYLTQDFAGGKYGTNYRNIIGIIEHAYYHLGQVVLIKKLINEST